MKLSKQRFNGKFTKGYFGLGFESRCTNLLRKNENNINAIEAIGYHKHGDEELYALNKSKFTSITDKIFDYTDKEFESYFQSLTFEDLENIYLDISVLSRHRLAVAISEIMSKLKSGSTLTVGYSLADFTPPSDDFEPVLSKGPISSAFRGILGNLGDETVAILGLGYEREKALGINNYLDPGTTILLNPVSPILEFGDYVLKNNSELLRTVPSEYIISYDPIKPYSTYNDLKQLIVSLNNSRPIIVPLGPKMLAALSVILSIELNYQIPVWRVSSEHTERVVDRKASGIAAEFTVHI